MLQSTSSFPLRQAPGVSRLAFLACAVVCFGLFAGPAGAAGSADAVETPAPPVAVTTAVVKAGPWQPILSATGALKALNGVQVSADVQGIISKIAFESGRTVKKGDLLVELDTRAEQAKLQSAQARFDLAKSNLKRRTELLQKKATSQAEFENFEAEVRQSEAAVNESLAAIARKTITAPFDGVLGIRRVSLGQFINTGTPIVALESKSNDPIYVEFAVRQQDYARIALQEKIKVAAEGVENKEFPGEITAIDSLLNEASHCVHVEAAIHDPQGLLRPGMFVRVEVFLPERKGVLSVPPSAVNTASTGETTVFVVKEIKSFEGKLEKQVVPCAVQVGEKHAAAVEIVNGLADGDEVVTSDLLKLRPNASVLVKRTGSGK